MLEAQGLKSRVRIDDLLRLLCLTLEVRLRGILFRLILLLSEIGQSLLHACDEALAALVRLGLDDLCDVLALLFLLGEEVVQNLDVDAILLHIDDS